MVSQTMLFLGLRCFGSMRNWLCLPCHADVESLETSAFLFVQAVLWQTDLETKLRACPYQSGLG